MESVLYGQPEDAMPLCVRALQVRATDQVLAEVTDHRQSLQLNPPIDTDDLSIKVHAVRGRHRQPGAHQVGAAPRPLDQPSQLNGLVVGW